MNTWLEEVGKLLSVSADLTKKSVRELKQRNTKCVHVCVRERIQDKSRCSSRWPLSGVA